MLGAVMGVGTTRDDVAENAQPGDAGDVADHDGELEVHLDECLLHTLDVRGGAVHQGLAVTQAQGRDGGGRGEAAPQQSDALQLLEPLGSPRHRSSGRGRSSRAAR
jgi:hypothetical protein